MSKQVSTMIKQGFISDPSITSPPPLKPTTTPPPSPPPPLNSRHTLFHMMSEEQLRESKHTSEANRRKLEEKLAKIMVADENGGGFGCLLGSGFADVKLSISGRDGFSVCMDVHRRVLVDKSRFFAQKLRDVGGVSHCVEICDCDDVEVYVETLVLMYSIDLKKRLLGLDVGKVLALLKVCAAIMFEDGLLSCLEYLEAVPWSEDEEEKIISCLTDLQLHDTDHQHVLQRVITEPSTSSRPDDLFTRMLTGVLQAKDDRARKEMKSLIARLLREELTHNTQVSKETLYSLCHRCLSSLILCLSEATCIDENKLDRGSIMVEVAREADNLQWIVDILVDKKMADDFVKLWADQKELANLHSKIPTMYRHEISRVTSQLCIAIGRGQIVVPKETRYALLLTWLEPLYEDFGWMRRANRSVDKKLVEDGLGQTILTLTLGQQQRILMDWFDRFLSKGDECPNIQRAFEIWWRRAFVRQYVSDNDQSKLQIALCDYP